MIDFNEEVKKFNETLLVDELEDEVYSYKNKDIVELLSEIMEEMTKKG